MDVAGPLAAMGHRVTGVDNGAGMIAALPADVEGVVADAASVRLARSFGCVLLSSHLVNDPDAGAAFLATAAAHVAPDGVVIVETYPPGYEATSHVGTTDRIGDAEVTLLQARVAGDRLTAGVRYGVDGSVWQQAFTARILDEATLPQMLVACGLTFDRWLPRPGWLVARPT